MRRRNNCRESEIKSVLRLAKHLASDRSDMTTNLKNRAILRAIEALLVDIEGSRTHNTTLESGQVDRREVVPAFATTRGRAQLGPGLGSLLLTSAMRVV